MNVLNSCSLFADNIYRSNVYKFLWNAIDRFAYQIVIAKFLMILRKKKKDYEAKPNNCQRNNQSDCVLNLKHVSH